MALGKLVPTGPLFMLIFALAVGNFVIGMGAFVVVGLLTPIADSFQISVSHAALVFAAYTATYAVMSPLLIGISGSLGRRNVLIAAMTVFTIASLLTAVAPNPALLFLSRAIAALGGCVFTPVAASVAFSAVPPARRGRALATVFLGMSGAQALGVPAGTFIGFAFGWQATFVILAAMAGGTILLLAAFIPATAVFQMNSLRTLLSAGRDWRRLVGVLVTATHFGSMCMLYAFISPVVADLAGMGAAGANFVLLVFGVGATISSVLIGYVVDRVHLVWTMVVMIVAQALIMPAFSFMPLPSLVVVVLSFVWALTGPGFMIPQQALLIARSPNRQTIMLSLNATANYTGTTIGTAIGAVIVHYWGLEWLGLFAGGLAVLALLNFLVGASLAPVPAGEPE